MKKQVVDQKQRIATSATSVANHILQRAAVNAMSIHDLPFIVHKVLRSHGQSLDSATRAFM